MTTYSLSRKLAAEGLGTAFLLATVVGSGIMGDTFSGINPVYMRAFIGAQIVAAIIVTGFAVWLYKENKGEQ